MPDSPTPESLIACCPAPDLVTVRSFYGSSHDAEALRQCRGCGRYWFFRFHEHVSFVAEDEITTWHTPLSEEQGRGLATGDDRPDLAFLEALPSLMADNDGARWVRGQPGTPWS